MGDGMGVGGTELPPAKMKLSMANEVMDCAPGGNRVVEPMRTELMVAPPTLVKPQNIWP